MNFVKACWTVVAPLVVIIIAAACLFAVGHGDAAWAVSNLGTILVLIGNLVYIVIWNSRKRWPGTTAWERLVKVMTFERN